MTGPAGARNGTGLMRVLVAGIRAHGETPFPDALAGSSGQPSPRRPTFTVPPAGCSSPGPGAQK